VDINSWTTVVIAVASLLGGAGTLLGAIAEFRKGKPVDKRKLRKFAALAIIFLVCGGIAAVAWGLARRGEAPAVSVINIEDPKFAGPQRPALTSPIQVTWVANGQSINSNLVVQIHLSRDGRLVFPASDLHEEHSSGVVIPLQVGTYELKLWNPGAERPLRSIYFDIVER
jgi:hypothetical protein